MSKEMLNNSYSKITPKDWYNATGEYVENNTTLIYTNEFGGEWIIEIKE